MISVKSKAESGREMRFPRIVISDGTLEALKWLALLLMTVDHVNKYLLQDSVSVMFAAGRLAFPLFGFVLAYNLARPEAFARGSHWRTMKRLAVYGAIAEIPFVALGGLGWGWWPLNIMATLFIVTAVTYLIEKGGKWNRIFAAGLFVVGGGFVEFWWVGVAMCLGAWWYCKRPSFIALMVWWGATAGLFVINRNWWAWATMPLVLIATSINIKMPRFPCLFYWYYPGHLAALYFVQKFQ